MNIILLILLSLISCVAVAETDSISMSYDIDEITVAAIKQSNKLETEPFSKSIISIEKVELNRTKSIRDASSLAPNIFIPDYGSRMTSSIYVRGIGSRIDNPVVGLNIDNVPYLNKNAFDTDVTDIARIEMIRGPQSTLYGRNTLGGVINIYTLSPFNYQGLRVNAEAANGKSFKIKTSYFNKVSDKFAYSAAIAINSTDGFFKNTFTNQLLDWENSYSARIKLQYKANQNTQIENTASVSHTSQGGYPYANLQTGIIAYNDTSSYTRTNFNDALTINHNFPWAKLASITSYSFMSDAMRLDQDFTTHPYFTLTQASQEHYITEDLSLKLNTYKNYHASFGLFAMFKSLKMQAPVTFKEYGIENLILKNMNEQLSPYYYKWNEDEFLLNSQFINNIFNIAFYHESAYETDRWKTNISLRADIEHNILNYHSTANSSASLYDENNQLYSTKDIKVNQKGNPNQTFLVLLPKLSVLYKLGPEKLSTIYFTAAMGHKAGGFNTQMFSDIIQQDIMSQFGVGAEYNVDDIIKYKPEYNISYEIGSHIETSNQKLLIDLAIFYIDAFNQQLTVFPEGQTTGRMMTNAGRSRSFGAEISTNIKPVKNLDINLAYGYTNAKFIKYISGNNNYKGKYVPYAPQHTLFVGANYSIPLGDNTLIIDVNANGAGKIFWNEDNSFNQSFYMLLNSSISFKSNKYSVSLWGKNLTNTKYNTFYFKSIGQEFVQRGKPITYGISINLNI